jgi:hypothetical protein
VPSITDAGGGGVARRIIRSLRRRELLLSNAFGNDDVTPMASGLRGYLWIFPLAGGAVTRALASGDFGLEGHEHALRRSVIGRELLLDRWLASRVDQPGERWRQWLSMMLFDREFLDLYAARVAGTRVLAGSKLRLAHLIGRPWLAQRRRLEGLRRVLAGLAAGAQGAG